MPTIAKKKRTNGAATKKTAAKRAGKITAESLVKKALEGIANRIESEEMKATIGDLIRLLQLKQEMDADGGAKEIKVTWVEPADAPASEK